MNDFENNIPQADTPPIIDPIPVAQIPTFSAPTPPDDAPVPPVAKPAYLQPPVPKPPRKGRSGLVAVVLCCSLAAGALGAGGVLLGQRLAANQQNATSDSGALQSSESLPAMAPGETPPLANPDDGKNVSTMLEGIRENSVIDIVEIDTSRMMTPAEVYAANVGSTVGITTSITTTNFWGMPSTAAASGSGFIISEDGYILTNFHVIEDSDSITVALYSGEEHEATLIGYDESNDIAVLKIDAQGLPPVILGDSDNLNVGDTVLAIGNPLGELTFSLTTGIISAKSREVTFSNGVTMDLLQTDCAINSGNSGGALFNLYGEVIGVTNAKYSSSSSGASIDNIGFAIPLNSIRSIVESIIEKGYVSKPYLGVSVTDVSAELQAYGLPQGAAVQSVVKDGPAAKAGLQAGDIITHVGDTQITGSNMLVDLVSQSQIGGAFEMTVYRKGQTIQLTATIEEKIQNAQEETPSNNGGAIRPWGN
ncbi:MAG: trypsin-like peptidase domain-containing protein [Oscillospiraceae bacterium]|nr:trypsin-like peptidase domain-containing protein [Oscillospiraceae bacterium]